MPPDPPRRAPNIFLGAAPSNNFYGQPPTHPPWQNPGSAPASVTKIYSVRFNHDTELPYNIWIQKIKPFWKNFV